MKQTMEKLVGKELRLRMDQPEDLRIVAHALSSDVRLRILAMIGTTSMNVNEIARELGVPVSTTALNIQILERAGLVSCEMQPGARGAMKMCVRGIDRVHISLSPTPRGERRVWEFEMPVGCYALVGGVQPTCGMANRNRKMNADDDVRSFYQPNHFEADILWMRASASMPLLSRMVEIDGGAYSDGGSADSVPLRYFEGIGYDRNVVILTQPPHFRKEKNKLLWLLKIGLRKYPNLYHALAVRHLRYNETMEYIEQAEKEGRIFVIRPPEALNIGAGEKDPAELERVYQIGRKEGARCLKGVAGFLNRGGVQC